MNLTWAEDGDEHNATGEWRWNIYRHVWPAYIDKPNSDSWILRGRPTHYGTTWKWFGGYRGLNNAKSWAQRMDDKPEMRGTYEENVYEEGDDDAD